MIKYPSFLFRFSLRSKILIPLISISFLTFTLSFWIFYWYLENNSENEIKKHAETIANTIIYCCDASYDPNQIQRLVTTLQLETDVEMILTIAGNPPMVFASSRVQWLNNNLSVLRNLPDSSALFNAATSPRMSLFEKRTAEWFDYITSIKVSKTGLQGISGENGAVFVRLNIQSARTKLSLAVFRMTIGLLLSTCFVAFIIFLIIRGYILRPADAIINTMMCRTNGDAKSRVPVFSTNLNDKIVAISLSLNEMLDELELESSRRSLTEQKLRESEAKLLELNANKNTFFSIIAHDLKSPFHSILGFSKLLQDEFTSSTPEQQQLFLNRINEGLNNVFTLLENLLEWSRVQLGRIDFNPKVVNIGSLIFEIAGIYKLSADKKAQTVLIDIPPYTFVHADKDMLRTILSNLISNAVKFTPDNKTIRITTLTSRSCFRVPEGFIGITITDEGIGIRKEDLALLFRIDSGFQRKGTAMESGTGLGLILCKEFVEKHGGNIWVESEENKGSSFTFTVPFSLIYENNSG